MSLSIFGIVRAYFHGVFRCVLVSHYLGTIWSIGRSIGLSVGPWHFHEKSWRRPLCFLDPYDQRWNSLAGEFFIARFLKLVIICLQTARVISFQSSNKSWLTPTVVVVLDLFRLSSKFGFWLWYWQCGYDHSQRDFWPSHKMGNKTPSPCHF